MSHFQETEIGTIPSEWDYEQLESFFDLITYGFTNPMPTVDEGPYMITAKDINDGRIKYENARKTSIYAFDKLLTDKSRPIKNDILITKDASIGRVAIVKKEDLCINQSVALIRPNKRIRPLFLKYLLESPNYQKLIYRDASGSTILHIYITRINKMLIGVPSLKEQDAILGVIHTIQNKIDLLKAQNTTLETIAQTIFKEWFGKYQIGDDLPDGWRVGKLGNVGKIICGKTPSKSNENYFGNEVPFIKIPDMHGKMFVLETTDNLSIEGATSQNNKMLPKDSIAISCIATVGLVSITTKNSQTNQQINSIIPENSHFREFLYFTLTEMKKYLNDLGSGGTATLNVNTSTFSNIELIIPVENKLQEFHILQNPIFEKILKNNIQIQSLTKTRDTLLPKLMSGQVRVKM